MFFLILSIIGLTAGFLSGMFGIGGGILIVPSLVYGLGFSQKLATGTSLAILLPPVGIAAVWEYYQHGNVNLRAALIIASMVFIGSWFGASIANHLDTKNLKMMFGALLIIVGLYVVINAISRPN